QSPGSTPAPWQYESRDPRPDDVSIEVLFCGVCHTDIHFVENDWDMTVYPVVPGHEIIGRVTAVGPEVRRFKAGDLVGVGCLVDSCRECSSCTKGLEQYCVEGPVFTYNGIDRHDGRVTYGGYSERLLVSERFVAQLPDGLDPAAAAPILCAGITTYSPLRHVGVKPGDRVGVVGMGGLGHMGIKFAKAMGAEVTLFTRTAAKVDEGKRNGADHVVISSDEEQMEAAAGSLQYLLDTVPVEHDLNPYMACLGVDGVYLLVGQLTPLSPPVEAFPMILGRRSILGSAIGGMPETQEVLDFCAQHDISCDIEMLDIRNIGEAYERMKRGDVRYRFVIDMATLKED
ncbi:MAG: NAD(P)-dependent alcohol dehydrogenase, partial [Gammaproteobacteria bacterium]